MTAAEPADPHHPSRGQDLIEEVIDDHGRSVISVVIADDHGAIRAGLSMIITGAEGLEVIGEAADGAAVIRQARALRPDVILMDIRMPGTDGIEATRVIVEQGWAQVLILTTFDIDDYAFGALRAGAAGFLLKSVEPAALVEAIRRVAGGDGVLAPEVTRRVLNQVGQALTPESPAEIAGLDQLTEREREVLAALGRGLTNVELAADLVITEATAKTHVSRVLMKLGLNSRTQAALAARTAGLV